MSWEVGTHSKPKARKEHHCQASDWILNFPYTEYFDEEEKEVFDQARREDFKILVGTKYMMFQGKWNGEFTTYRARKDLNDLCIKYEIFDEDA